MPEPHATHAARREKQPAPSQLVSHPDLPIGGFVQGERHGRVFDVRLDPVFRNRFAAADLGQGLLTSGFDQLLKAAEAIARVAYHFAGLADAAQGFGQLQQPQLVLDYLLLCSDLTVSCVRPGAGSLAELADQVSTNTDKP